MNSGKKQRGKNPEAAVLDKNAQQEQSGNPKQEAGDNEFEEAASAGMADEKYLKEILVLLQKIGGTFDKHIEGLTEDAKSISNYRWAIAGMAIAYSTSPYLIILYLFLCGKMYLLNAENSSLIWLIVALVSSSTLLTTIMLSGVFRSRPSNLVSEGIRAFTQVAHNNTGN